MKPTNIELVGSDGKKRFVKWTDFGLGGAGRHRVAQAAGRRA